MTARPGGGRVVRRLYRTQPDHPAKLRRMTAANQVALRAGGRLGRADLRTGRNLTVSHTHRFVWYRVAKVATRSIYMALRTSGLELELSHAGNIRYPRGTFDGYFAFAFVRHPIDRFESCWRDKICKKNHFGLDDHARLSMQADIGEFVEFAESFDLDRGDRHLRRQCRLIDLDAVEFIGRYEQLGEDFAVVAERIGKPGLELPWNNRSPVPVRDQTLSPALAARVRELYAEDFDRFGYD